MRTNELHSARTPRRLGGLGLTALSLTLAACGGGSAVSPTVTGLRIQQAVAAVQIGSSPTSVQLTLVADFADGSSATYGGSGAWPHLSSPASWASDAPGTATVADGEVAGLAPGRTMVRATLAGFEASVPAIVSCVPASTATRVPVSDTGTGLTLGGSGSHAGRSLAIDTLGRIHVVWFDSATGVRYARSLDGGLSFLASVPLVDAASAPSAAPIIGCGQEGQDDVYVVYTDSASAVRCLRSPDAGVTWLTPGVVTGLPAFGQHSLGVRGTTVMIFTTSSSTMARSTDAGQTFGAPVPNLLTGSAFNDVLMDPRDLQVVAISDTPSLHVKTSQDDGATFGAQADPASPSLFYSDYAIDRLGNVFAVSQQGPWVRMVVDTQAVTTVPSVLAGSGNPGRSLAIDRDNAIHVVRESGGSILMQVSADQGATISPEVELDTASSVPHAAASYAHPGAGVIYLRSGSVFYRHN